VLSEFSRENQANCCLDLSARESALLAVSHQFAGFEADTLEDVVDEAVHDVHGALADSSVGVDLFEHTVDVQGEGL